MCRHHLASSVSQTKIFHDTSSPGVQVSVLKVSTRYLVHHLLDRLPPTLQTGDKTCRVNLFPEFNILFPVHFNQRSLKRTGTHPQRNQVSQDQVKGRFPLMEFHNFLFESFSKLKGLVAFKVIESCVFVE